MTSAGTSSVEAVCVFCGGLPRKIHADTGRCQTCGRVAMSPTAAPSSAPPAQNGTVEARHAAPRAEPFRLPASRQARKWLAEARTMREAFLASASKAEQAARENEQVAQRFRRAAAVFTQLLEQVDVEPSLPDAPVDLDEHRRAPGGKWPEQADACLGCGRADVVHCAKGFCKRCYDRRHQATRRAS